MATTLSRAESESKKLDSLRQRILQERDFELHERTDRMFAWLMVAQWIGAIAAAWLLSPLTWSGAESSTHLHLKLGIFGGAMIAAFPVFLAWRSPGMPLTRYCIAAAQMLFSALLIHLTGGRLETHFHVFGSLAFLALYREFRIIVIASAVIGADHVLRSIFWPQSVFGVVASSWWRPLEHIWWVAFEDTCLFFAIRQMCREARGAANSQAQVLMQQSGLQATVDHLLVAVQAAAAGDLTRQIKVSKTSEVTELAEGLQGMQADLRETIGQVTVNANAFAQEADEIVEGAQTLTCGAIEQQRASLQMADAVERLVELIGQVNSHLSSATELADRSTSLLQEGERDMQESVEAITRVEESSLKIGEITHAIQDIAAQTHLLALNATIEASRAGEAGKGFAVVATEVKELAKQVSNSADEITALSEEVNGRVREGVTLIRKTGDSMEQIGQRVQQTTSSLAAISDAADQQAPQVEEVSRSITRVGEISEHTVTRSTEWANRGKGLEKRADNLRKMVSKFQLEADSNSTAT